MVVYLKLNELIVYNYIKKKPYEFSFEGKSIEILR